MKKIAIITSRSLTHSQKTKNSGIVFKDIDFSINFSDIAFMDSDLPQDKLFALIFEKKEIPKTSQPSYQEFKDIILNRLKEYEKIIIIMPSRYLSGAYQGCLNVINDLEENLGKGKVFCVEANSIAMAEAHTAEFILDELQANKDIETIVESCKNIKGNTYAFTSDAEFLKLSGRVSGAQAMTINLLKIKPIVWMKAFEKPILAAKGRGFKFILKYIDQTILTEENLNKKVFLSNINLEEDNYNTLIDYLKSQNIDYEILEDAPAMVATHFGSKAIGFYIF